MDDERFVSAVVKVRPEEEAVGGVAVENPAGVASEAAAMLADYDLGAPIPSGSAEAAPTEVGVPEQGSPMAAAKAWFTRAGFEVHAPVGTTFSIGAAQSHFEEMFGRQLAIDEEQLGAPVRTIEGEEDLPLERLPEDIRGVVERVHFPPPPELPTGFV